MPSLPAPPPSRRHDARLADARAHFLARHAGFHREKARFLGALIPPGARVLEIGCGLGDALAACRPAFGVGVDLSPATLRLAARRHPELRFAAAEAAMPALKGAFDFVILDGLLGELVDIQAFLETLRPNLHPRSRLILTWYSKLWQPAWLLWEKLGWKLPQPRPNWLRERDVANFLELADFEIISTRRRILLPLGLPLLAPLANRVLVHLPALGRLSMMGVALARPRPVPRAAPTVTVAVPCRNERGTIAEIFRRLPDLGAGVEIIFCDGNSTDDTLGEIRTQQKLHPTRRAVAFSQGEGRGKGDAVRQIFARATGDVLLILDADLTVPPEELPKFVRGLVEGRADFMNGSRLIYPMEKEAMQHLNHLANWFFGVLFTWLIDQPVRDTLCGAKALWREDYERIVRGRAHFGDFDPFGDFDLLFGAARLHLRIRDLPVRYRARTYGETNISRFRHGWLLLKMSLIALRKLKMH